MLPPRLIISKDVHNPEEDCLTIKSIDTGNSACTNKIINIKTYKIYDNS